MLKSVSDRGHPCSTPIQFLFQIHFDSPKCISASQKGLFPSGFPTKIVNAFLDSFMPAISVAQFKILSYGYLMKTKKGKHAN